MKARLDIVLPCLGGVLLACLVLAACWPPASTPEDYHNKLQGCLDSAKSWAEYEPCCTRVALEQGRDPSFCYQDGGL